MSRRRHPPRRNAVGLRVSCVVGLRVSCGGLGLAPPRRRAAGRRQGSHGIYIYIYIYTYIYLVVALLAVAKDRKVLLVGQMQEADEAVGNRHVGALFDVELADRVL